MLATKLCSLLHRSELRDLQDVRELLVTGSSLEQGLADAPLVEAGFSTMTLAWLLDGLDPVALRGAANLSAEDAAVLDTVRHELIARLVRSSRPT
ncbi:MAG: hypothetical protein JXB32_18535 [Deltaproteobacteria bacterium]|nr:hypothetical protein [Deltaproteobacteria bacterium]